jgi:hypothetical protein
MRIWNTAVNRTRNNQVQQKKTKIFAPRVCEISLFLVGVVNKFCVAYCAAFHSPLAEMTS